MSKTGLPMLASVLVLAALGLAASMTVIRNAPAFSEDLRRESVLGDWRMASSEGLYDKSSYFFDLGVGYLRGDAAALLLGEDELPPWEVFEAMIERSAELFEASLSTTPGHADAWTGLAWAHVLLGDAAAAEDALQTSWALAPHNLSEASDRLSIVEALDEITGRNWRTGAHGAAIASDLETLGTFAPRSFERFVARTPSLAGPTDNR